MMPEQETPEREILAELIFNADPENKGVKFYASLTSSFASVQVWATTALAVADALIAAGYRKPEPITEARVEYVAAALRDRSTWPSLHWPSVQCMEHDDVAFAFARAALEASEGKR